MPGIVLRSEQAGVLAREPVAVVQIRRQHDAIGDAVASRTHVVEARRVARPVEPRRHVRGARRHLVDAGEQHVRGVLVARQTVRHRPDDGKLVRARRQLRQVLADLDARRPVAIGWKLPRTSAGASGFRSNVSRWLGAPVRKIRMTDFALPPDTVAEPPDAVPPAALARRAKSDGRPIPSRPQ